jgi:hypothetical protein
MCYYHRFLVQRARWVKVEALTRKFLNQRRYQSTVRKVVLLQSAKRMYLAKLRYRKARKAATNIESGARRFLGVRRYRRVYRALLRIQRAGHRYVLNVRLRKRIMGLHANAIASNARVVDAHLITHPLDWLVRNKVRYVIRFSCKTHFELCA